LGYFQTYEDRLRHPASLNCPVVRRASGGGAIVHDAELTYSLVVAAESHLALQRGKLYRTVHDTLIKTLSKLGVRGASLFGQSGGVCSDERSFLCFQRRSPGDVIYRDAKIVGSAQRRRRDAVLQHGSILLGRSDAAPELPGIREVARRELTGKALMDAWLPRLAEHLGLNFSDRTLTSEQQRRAQELVRSKYGAQVWTRDRDTRSC